MTDRWPYWVVVERQDDGSWRPNRETISKGQDFAIISYSLKIGDAQKAIRDGTIDIRRCRIELEPIEVKP